MTLRAISLLCVLLTFPQSIHAAPLSANPQARYERIGQIVEAADHGHAFRYRAGITLGSGGALTLHRGRIVGPECGFLGWTLNGSGISYGVLGALFIGLGVGTSSRIHPRRDWLKKC